MNQVYSDPPKISLDYGEGAHVIPKTIKDCTDCGHDCYELDGDNRTGKLVTCRSSIECKDYHMHTELKSNGGRRNKKKKAKTYRCEGKDYTVDELASKLFCSTKVMNRNINKFGAPKAIQIAKKRAIG